MTRSRANRKQVVWAVSSLMLLASMISISTTAAADASSDTWTYSANIYLWGAGIDATTQTGGDIDISFSDILDNLDMAFMGGFAARKGKWSLFADAIYMDISASDGDSETIPILGGAINITRTVDADVKMESWITTLGAGYNVVDNEKATLDLIGGARYLWLDTEIKLNLKRDGVLLETSRQIKASESDSVWDGVVGIKGRINLNDKWYMPYYADVGTGGSDLTWQVLAGIGYTFKWGDMLLAYRYLDYDFDSDFMLKDMNISGPALGAKFYF